jgi:hypothetical protein
MEDLPQDVIKCIMLQMRIGDILTFGTTCKNFNNNTYNIFSIILSDMTGLDTNNYSIRELKILYMNKTFGEKRIVSKYGRTCIVTSTGKVYKNSTLEIIHGLGNILKVDIGLLYEIFLSKDGKVYVSRNYGYMPELVKDVDDAIDITAGSLYFFILLRNGNILKVEDETVTIPLDVKNIIKIETFSKQLFFISSDNKLYTYLDDCVKPILDNVKKVFTFPTTITTLELENGNFSVFENKKRCESNYNIIDISVSLKTILYLDNNGHVYVTGDIDRYLWKNVEGYQDCPSYLFAINNKKMSRIIGLENIIFIYNSYSGWFFVDSKYKLYVMAVIDYTTELKLLL